MNEARREELNRKFAALLPGAEAIHVRMKTAAEVASRIFYATKSPIHDSRAYPLKEEIADSFTGEVASIAQNKFEQKTRPFRPGDAVKAFQVMGDRTIPMLIFAGGDGIAIREGALSVAEVRISVQHDKRQRHLKRLLNPTATAS